MDADKWVTRLQKLYKFGLENLSEYELIAILIRSGSKKEDVLTL